MPSAPPNPPTPNPRPAATRRRGTPVARNALPQKTGFWPARAVRMLTHTRAEWAAVGAAQMTPRSIYLGFLLPMAALGPLATTLGTILSGGERTSLAGTYTLSVPSAILAGVLEYAFNLGAIWGLALLIDRLAPAFQAQQGRVEALKLAAFGATPYWVGGLLGLIPKLAPVGVLLGLYSLRLYSLGLPTLMRAPGDRLSSYTFAIGAGGVVLVLFASALLLLVTS